MYCNLLLSFLKINVYVCRYLAPETFAKVNQLAKNFTTDVKKLWKTKASYKFVQALPYVNGEFNIPILRVGQNGEMLLPTPKPPKTSSGKKPGPVPKPFLEKKKRARQYAAAEIAKGQDEHALMQAASSKIGKFNKDMAYVMRKIKDKPQQASKFRHLMKKKNKGI